MKKVAALIFAAAMLAGCQEKNLKITRHADGSLDVGYVKRQLFNGDSVEAVEITKDGDGYTVEVRGVNNEAQVSGEIAEGVARGLSGVAK